MRMNQKLRIGCLVGFICVGLVGCRSAEAENAETVSKNESCQVETLAIPDYPKEPVYKSEDERWEANHVRRELVNEKFETALEDFSIKTASVLLTKESGNTVYSPVGLYYALSLAAEGASGKT